MLLAKCTVPMTHSDPVQSVSFALFSRVTMSTDTIRLANTTEVITPTILGAYKLILAGHHVSDITPKVPENMR